MSITGHLIWFVATAAMIVAVLTVGTLAAADLLPTRSRAARDVAPDAAPDAAHDAAPVAAPKVERERVAA